MLRGRESRLFRGWMRWGCRRGQPLRMGLNSKKCLGTVGLGATHPREPGAVEPPEGATGLRPGAWTWQGKASFPGVGPNPRILTPRL